jgi:hypothetical protein
MFLIWNHCIIYRSLGVPEIYHSNTGPDSDLDIKMPYYLQIGLRFRRDFSKTFWFNFDFDFKNRLTVSQRNVYVYSSDRS